VISSLLDLPNSRKSLFIPCLKFGEVYGATYNGCDFDPIKSFRASGISIKKICESYDSGRVRGFKLTHPKKSSVLARITDNYGSGGANSILELDFLANKKNFCKVE
jgi:hypothetical protein